MRVNINLSRRQRAILKWVGYVSLGLVTLVMALHFTFSYERLVDAYAERVSDKYKITYTKVKRGWKPGTFWIENVQIESRRTKPDDKITVIFLRRLDIDVSLMSVVTNAFSGGTADYEATLISGKISGEVTSSNDLFELSMTSKGLPLGDLTFVHSAVGLPMDGRMNLDVHLRVPSGNWKEAEGKITMSCPGCTIGDGVAKIKPRPRPGARAAFAGEGLTVPTLDLGDFAGEIAIAKGKGVIKRFSGTSKDGELVLVGEMQMGRKFAETTFPGCVRFKVSDDLKQRHADFGNIQMVMGTPIDAEGYSNLRTKGKIGDLRYLPASSCENGGEPPDDGVAGGPTRRTSRPTVITPPDDDGTEPAARPGLAPEGAEAPPDKADELNPDDPPPGMKGEPSDVVAPRTDLPAAMDAVRAGGRGGDDVRGDTARPGTGGPDEPPPPPEPELQPEPDPGDPNGANGPPPENLEEEPTPPQPEPNDGY
jgi:type II secretion system protein N